MDIIVLLWLVFLFGPPVTALVSGAACGVSCSRSTSGVVRLWYALPLSLGIGLVIGLAGVVLNVIVAVLLFFGVAYATAGEGDDWATPGMGIVAVATTIAAPVAAWVLGESLILRRRRWGVNQHLEPTRMGVAPKSEGPPLLRWAFFLNLGIRVTCGR